MRTTIINSWSASYRNTAHDTVPIAASRVCLLRLLLDVSAADGTPSLVFSSASKSGHLVFVMNPSVAAQARAPSRGHDRPARRRDLCESSAGGRRRWQPPTPWNRGTRLSSWRGGLRRRFTRANDPSPARPAAPPSLRPRQRRHVFGAKGDVRDNSCTFLDETTVLYAAGNQIVLHRVEPAVPWAPKVPPTPTRVQGVAFSRARRAGTASTEVKEKSDDILYVDLTTFRTNGGRRCPLRRTRRAASPHGLDPRRRLPVRGVQRPRDRAPARGRRGRRHLRLRQRRLSVFGYLGSEHLPARRHRPQVSGNYGAQDRAPLSGGQRTTRCIRRRPKPHNDFR